MRLQFIGQHGSCGDGRPTLRAERGMTIVETLLALAIGSILMLAMAAAVMAMCNSYAGNTGRNAAMQGARHAVYRICSDVRQANNGGVLNPTTLWLERTTEVIDPSTSAVVRTTRWDVYAVDVNRNLRLYRNYTAPRTLPLNANLPSSVLARDVSSLAFNARLDGSDRLAKVEIRITLSPAHGSFMLSDSAVCRRNRALPDPGDSNPLPNPITANYVNPPPL